MLTGFKELEKEGKISLIIVENYDRDIDGNVPDRRIIEALVNNKIRLAFDMTDGYCFDKNEIDEYLRNIDYYFKRSFSPTENQKYSEENIKKIHPLSFDWDVSWFFNPMEWTRSIFDIKTLIKKLTFRNDVKYYEKSVSSNRIPILFMCRLWAVDGSEKISESSKKQREKINEMRIGIIRCLKEKYGNDFLGGVENNSTARELCPDLILPKYYTKRIIYMNLMKKSSICIASTGLFNSIGWKLAEYVAAGKAIVSENLNYQVIGNFTEGINYLGYDSIKQCVDAVDTLYSNPELIEKMRKENKKYYYNYQRPDKQMEYVLNLIKEGC